MLPSKDLFQMEEAINLDGFCEGIVRSSPVQDNELSKTLLPFVAEARFVRDNSQKDQEILHDNT